MNKLLAIGCTVLLSGCVPALICVGGGAVGSMAVRNRTGVSGSFNDNVVHANILNELSRASLFKGVEVSVKHSRVLLLGYVESKERKAQAIDIARNSRGVSEVIDELKIGHKETFEHSVIDSSITSRIKSAMLFDGNVHAFNFNITTYEGVVYILGSADNQLEKDIVVNIARTTSNVKKVISYINTFDRSKEKAKHK